MAGLGVLVVQRLRNYKRNSGLLHFFQLIARNALLQGENVFCLDAPPFVEYLSPAVFTGRFESDYKEPGLRP